MVKKISLLAFAALLHFACIAQQTSIGTIGNQPIDNNFLKNIQTVWPQFTFVHDTAALKAVLTKLYSVNRSTTDAAHKNLPKTDSIFAQIEQAKQLLEIKILSEYYLQKQIDAVTVSEAEVVKYYNENKQRFTQPAEASFFQIMLNDTSKQSISEIKKLIDERKDLKGEALQASGTKNNEYSISYESYVFTKEFRLLQQIVAATQPGKLSPVVSEKGSGSFRMYYTLSYKPERIKTLEEAKDECKADLINTKRQQIIDTFYADATINYPVKLNPAFFSISDSYKVK